MATAASTLTPRKAPFMAAGTLTFDSKYVTGGESLTAASLGLQSVDHAIANIKTVAKEVNVASAFYDKATEKVLLFNETPAQVASEADVEGVVVEVTAFGKARAK